MKFPSRARSGNHPQNGVTRVSVSFHPAYGTERFSLTGAKEFSDETVIPVRVSLVRVCVRVSDRLERSRRRNNQSSGVYSSVSFNCLGKSSV